ncbi:fungal-specific transcription factor domain-containing protein [Mycena galopus ATCC 62051]|nr:fungal-specific transcription factor domain-containing protein [Mycena galopus ATCC 62051]
MIPRPPSAPRRPRAPEGSINKSSSCAECQRLKLRCDKKGPPCGSCISRRCESICPEGTLISTGRGKRSVMSHVPELNTVITAMGQRIQQLQDALIGMGVPVQKQKAFLATDFTHLSTTTPAQRGEVPGSLRVNGQGDAVYFGPTGGCAALFSTANASDSSRSPEGRFLFEAITQSFPFSANQIPSWDVDLALDQLFAHLPLEPRAWKLCDIYYRNGGWIGMPVMQSETVELLSLIYHNIGTEDEDQPTATATTQQMTVLFLIFALAALVDLDLPSDSTEAAEYLDLACAAMSLKSLFEDSTVETVQALTLFACYFGHGGPRFSMDRAWTMISLASQISQKLGLHRESFGSNLPDKSANRCRALFWETYSIETLYGLSVGRPPGTSLANVNCSFPPDEADDVPQPFVEVFPGYLHARWEYTKKVTAPIMEDFTTTSRPSYRAILEMDKRIRKYLQLCPCERFPSLENESPFAYVQRHLIPLLSRLHIMYIHRGSFVEAIRDKPADPFASPYSHSFSAAYMAALGTIEANKRNFTAHPLLFGRWWPTRESLLNAALIVGTVAARYPIPKPRHPHTILGLFAAVDLIEKITESGDCAGSGLTIIRRLLDKVVTRHSQVNSREDSSLPLAPDPEMDRELEIFTGKTCVVERLESALAQAKISDSSTSVLETREEDFWLNSLLGQSLDYMFPFENIPEPWATIRPEGPNSAQDVPRETDDHSWANFLPSL